MKIKYPASQQRIAEIHKMAYEQAYALIEERFLRGLTEKHPLKIIEQQKIEIRLLSEALKEVQSKLKTIKNDS